MKPGKRFLPVICFALISLAASMVLAQPSQPYTGQEAIGPDVIALWQFDGGTPGRDVSGKGHDLTLRGEDTHFVAEGKFGGALQVETKTQPGDARQGAQTPDRDDLTPQGAFTVEMWMAPDENLAKQNIAFLLDKKYYHYATSDPRANHDYLFLLRKSGKDQFVIEVQLGFGQDSATVRSTPQIFNAGQWYHVAFSYDGKCGIVIYLNGARVGEAQLKNRGAISNGPQNLVIGDRDNSTGYRFAGRIDEVRLSNKALRFVTGRVLLNFTGSRTAFLRDEKNAQIPFDVFNDTLHPLENATLRLKMNGVADQTLKLPAIASGQHVSVSVPVDTTLRPDRYAVTAAVEDAYKSTFSAPVSLELTIVPRPLPHQMPVIMWGSHVTSNYQELKDIGFTGQLVGLVADYPFIWNSEGKSTSEPQEGVEIHRQRIDRMFALQLGSFAVLSPGEAASKIHPEFNRTGPDGKTIDNTDGLYPRIGQFSRETGEAVARTFDDMPGWQGALIDTEVRDHTAPSFNEIDKKAYQEFSGAEIPSQAVSARGVDYRALPEFPASHIVPANDPLLEYYRWFWKDGDGWNALNSEVAQGLKSTGRNDLLTWYDPAVRTPGLYGSGGDVDYLNQWTYTYPNPLKIGLAADELLAMAGGRSGQKVMNMTQIIWYRSQTTKAPAKGHETEWEKISPDAKFISIAPNHLSEAMWLNLARPVQALAYHGWGSLGDKLGYSQGSYVTTNIDTRKRLTQLLHDIVQPLAPALMQVPDVPTDVAFLESFASQILAGRGTYGWGGGWGADSYMIACYAGLQPQIIYDETIEEKGLDQYKVLFLTDCDVLTQPVADAIQKVQQRGGIVIGDESLAPGIQPDIVLPSFKRNKPDAAKQFLLQKAAALRNDLDAFYAPAVQSSNPEVLTRLRRFGDSDYIFTVNDHRTFGDYVGQYGQVMEKGLPSQSRITLNRHAGFVYDLMNRREVQTVHNGGKLQFTVNLGAGEGDVFLVTDKAAGALSVLLPATVQRGQNIPVAVQLNDNTGRPLNAVVPLEVTIRDPQGRSAEKSGYYGAANGKLELSLDIASNDIPGQWQVEVNERLHGQKVTKNFAVK
jgi:hypothetical protein